MERLDKFFKVTDLASHISMVHKKVCLMLFYVKDTIFQERSRKQGTRAHQSSHCLLGMLTVECPETRQKKPVHLAKLSLLQVLHKGGWLPTVGSQNGHVRKGYLLDQVLGPE